MNSKTINNIAFIDGQNFFLGMKDNNWKIDFQKFRVYLRDKYNVQEAYYLLGFLDNNLISLYTNLQRAGFSIKFKEHNSRMKGNKKGNVDVDMVFYALTRLIDNRDDFNKIVLVSSDGDYIKLVKYLISKDRLEQILFPTNKPSSLYNKIDSKLKNSIKNIIGKIKR